MMLFFKECKKVLFSITFIAFAALLILMYVGEYNTGAKKITEPKENDSYYGHKYAVNSLLFEYSYNSYACYPIGFYKNVKLNEKKSNQILDILTELSNQTKDEITNISNDIINSNFYYGGVQIQYTEGESGEIIEEIIDSNNSMINLNSNITHEKFSEAMKKADKILGGGSKYFDMMMEMNFGRIEMTYEDAIENYNAIVETDKISGAYARLFCDYLGIVTSILPLFIAIAVCLKDKRSKMNELIFTRQVSSYKLILSRFFSIVTMCMICVLGLAVISTFNIASIYSEFDIDYFVIITSAILWLMPSVMISATAGMLITEATNTPIGIIVYGFIWFTNMMLGMNYMHGGYHKFLLIPRHNGLGYTQTYTDNFKSLLFNRIFYR